MIKLSEQKMPPFIWFIIGNGILLLWASSFLLVTTFGKVYAHFIPQPELGHSSWYAWSIAQLACQYAPITLTNYPMLKLFDWTQTKCRPPEDPIFPRIKDIRGSFMKMNYWIGAALLVSILLLKYA